METVVVVFPRILFPSPSTCFKGCFCPLGREAVDAYERGEVGGGGGGGKKLVPTTPGNKLSFSPALPLLLFLHRLDSTPPSDLHFQGQLCNHPARTETYCGGGNLVFCYRLFVCTVALAKSIILTKL